jgi:hypothetical protein
MRRRFENVNMVMGNCFSPVMEGSQFKWNNLSSTYKCNFLGADNKQ